MHTRPCQVKKSPTHPADRPAALPATPCPCRQHADPAMERQSERGRERAGGKVLINEGGIREWVPKWLVP